MRAVVSFRASSDARRKQRAFEELAYLLVWDLEGLQDGTEIDRRGTPDGWDRVLMRANRQGPRRTLGIAGQVPVSVRRQHLQADDQECHPGA